MQRQRTSNIPKKQEYGSALSKALTILEQITEQPQAIGLADLASRLGMPKQTLHRNLIQLEEEGLIVRDPTRDRFHVGPRLSNLAIGALFSDNHNMPTRSILQELVEEIGESCNIGILDGMRLVYLDRIQTDCSLRIHLEVGSRVPAYCTSGGKVLLAHLPDEMRRRLLRSRALERHTHNTITEPDRLEAHLANCRETGFSTNDEEFTAGIVGVAVPIVDASGRSIASVACHAPTARRSLNDLKSFVARIQASARALAHYWG